MELFFKIYEGLDREGPGSLEMTKRAFEMCEDLPAKPNILELGCGTGGATMNLAQISDGTITATDVYQPFLDRLAERAAEVGASDRVTPLVKDMGSLDFMLSQFDLIWSEGAAYIMGVDNAFAYWQQFLKPGGYLVISDAVWLTDDAPDEVKAFWAEGYPVMRTAEKNAKSAEAFGFKSVGHFIIDDQCWVDFYNDVERRLEAVESVYGDDPDGRAIIDSTRKEITLYRKYPDMYGYAMHVFKK